MKWNNLKKNKCPKCDEDLAKSINIRTMVFECPCGFKINQERYKEIVTSQVSERVEAHYRPEDENPETIE